MQCQRQQRFAWGRVCPEMASQRQPCSGSVRQSCPSAQVQGTSPHHESGRSLGPLHHPRRLEREQGAVCRDRTPGAMTHRQWPEQLRLQPQQGYGAFPCNRQETAALDPRPHQRPEAKTGEADLAGGRTHACRARGARAARGPQQWLTTPNAIRGRAEPRFGASAASTTSRVRAAGSDPFRARLSSSPSRPSRPRDGSRTVRRDPCALSRR